VSNGAIHVLSHEVGGDHWEVYAVEGTPAQSVQHGVLELVPRMPDLVVSGINYGENVGTGVTISGTVGAALEAASLGIPALAISLETPKQYHTSYSTEINFSVAAHFARKFAKLILDQKLPFDVDILKVDVPATATVETAWRVTRLSRQRYYSSVKPKREKLSDKGFIDYHRDIKPGLETDSDIAALVNDQVVSVSPISIDMTSRLDLGKWEKELRTRHAL
jgi:5'-nucleotidase